MSVLSKLVVAGIVVGIGAYFYDMNTAKTHLKDAVVVQIETEDRCREHHESMCKYYAKVLLKREKLEYKFRIPFQYYHTTDMKLNLNDRVPVVLKEKKIFPARILDLAPKYKAKLEELIAQDKI